MIVHAGLSPVRVPPIDPDEVVIYGLILDDWIGDKVITGGEWVMPVGLVSISEQIDVSLAYAGTTYQHVCTVKVSASAAVVGEHYLTTCRIAHSEGSTDRSIIIPCVIL